jgi:hypothetical protein
MAGHDPSALARCAEKAREQAEPLRAELSKDGGGERTEGLLSRYTEILLREKAAYTPYTHVRRQTEDLCRQIGAAYPGETSLGRFHQLLLLRLIAGFETNRAARRLPDSVLALYPQQFERIMASIACGPPAQFQFSNDDFTKDLCICSLRLIPTGARVVDLEGGLPRRLLFRQSALGCLVGAWKVAVSLRGFKPLVSVHVHRQVLEEFNHEGHERTFRRWGDLLSLNPRIKGVMGSAWFYDPAVRATTPHLACVRDVPAGNGAFFLYGGVDQDSVNSALATSRTRRLLYEEGQYRPKLYYMLWPRQALLRWCAGSCPPGRAGGAST